MSEFGHLELWKVIIENRIADIYRSINEPKYLLDNKCTFLTKISQQMMFHMQRFNFNRVGESQRIHYIYSIVLPLKKHFDGVFEQLFIKNITDKSTLNEAIDKILKLEFEWLEEVTTTTVQSTPNSAAKNYDGCGVGGGLKIPGTLQYWCLNCNKRVGFEESDYWAHQNQVHNNPKVVVCTELKRWYKYKM